MLNINRICKSYVMGDSEILALDNISLSINAAEYVAIVGSSGSGKSTLMNILGCLVKPDSGVYTLDAQNVAELDDDTLSRVRNQHIGFVFQQFHLQARRTALENVLLPTRYSTHGDEKYFVERAKALLAEVGLADRMHHQPSQLSGGQRQRVAIARALINEPKIVLADEPTGNLDSKTSHEIMNLFERLNALGQAIILVTHEPDIAARTQREIVLKDGKIQHDRWLQLA